MIDGYLANHFLVSMPSLEDQNFCQTVSLICQHDANGALGIIVNRLGEHTLYDVFKQLEIVVEDEACGQMPVLEGGPVHREYGLVVHNRSHNKEWQSTLAISDQLALTSSRDILVDMANGNGPDQAIMSLGYAGWGAGQLENEMMQNAWFSTPVDHDILFNTEVEQKWHQAAALIGMDYNKLTSQVGHA